MAAFSEERVSETTMGDGLMTPFLDMLAEAMERLKMPGVAVGMLLDGQEHLAGLGVTNVEHPLAVDADTLFQVGSTTKTVTATILMHLVEQGRLDLEAPVCHYVPDLALANADAAACVTLEGLAKGTRGDFERRADGSIAWLRIGGRIRLREG
jgi:CubicO group peptidase (beta-lactamase class C family)